MCNGKRPATCRVRHPGHDCPFVGKDKWLKDGKDYVPPPESSGEYCDPPPPRRYDPGGRGGGAPGRGRGFRGRGLERYQQRQQTTDQQEDSSLQHQQTSQQDVEPKPQDNLECTTNKQLQPVQQNSEPKNSSPIGTVKVQEEAIEVKGDGKRNV